MSLSTYNVKSQNGMEKHMIIRHCYILVGRGCDHTPIDNHSYVL